MGLLNSILECLKEFRDSDEWNGTDDDKKCIPVRLMMFQVEYLLDMNGGIATPENYTKGNDGWSDDYNLMKEWSGEKV